MAEMIGTFSKAENNQRYSDGSIEVEMLKMARKTEVDWMGDGRWPVVYHFSELRENILNWYPFTKRDDILEIGAGCGAITGMLCEKAGSVDALELTEIRSRINYERHAHLENLRIFITDIKDYRTDKKYDYVVINGVLEYAAYMFEGVNPYLAFLKCAKSFVKPKGHLLLAIENRLGIKYLSGSREDHTGERFSGINDYSHGERVKTFSKQELTKLIKHAGLHTLKCYYPYPDYKFAQEIFTDSSVNVRMPVSLDYHMDLPWNHFFEEQRFYGALMAQGVMDIFANSFLFDIGQKANGRPNAIEYVKISANRNVEYRIATILYDREGTALKRALTPAAKRHLEKLKHNAQIHRKGFSNIPCALNDEGLFSPMLKGRSLADVVADALQQGERQKAYDVVKKCCLRLYDDVPVSVMQPNEAFADVFGSAVCEEPMHWSPGMNVDLTAGNLFPSGDIYQVIDYEWMFPFAIPVEFSVWRMVSQLTAAQPSFCADALFAELGVTAFMGKTFAQWEEHFACCYVGIRKLWRLTRPREQVVFPGACIQRGYLFWRTEGSFCPEQSAECTYQYKENTNEYVACFFLPRQTIVSEFRWDPVEGHGCEVEITDIQLRGKIQKICVDDGTVDGMRLKLYSFDPQVLLQGSFEPNDKVEIHFRLRLLEWSESYRGVQCQRSQLQVQLERALHENEILKRVSPSLATDR